MDQIVLDVLVELAAPLAIVVLGMLATRSKDVALLPLLIALGVLDGFALNVHQWATPTVFIGAQWNWDGKIAALLLALGCLLFAPRAYLDQLGLLRGPAPGSGRALLLISGVIFAYAIARGFMGSMPYDAETIAFQSTMPGLHEEFTFRGLWWIVIAQSLERETVEAGKIPRWTLLATTAWFAAVHGVDWSAAQGLSINWFAIGVTAFSGALYGLLMAIGRCVWVPVLVHNLSNVILHALQMAR